MIEGGSVAAGDPQIEGRSDWEIAIVADKITDEDMDRLRNFMATLPQDDRVEIVYRITDQLLSHSNDMHYLTGKFRSKTLYGENLIDKIPLPSRDVIESFWLDRLKMTVKQIDKVNFVFMGPKISNRYWRWLIQKEGIKVVPIIAGKIRRYSSLFNVIDMLKLPFSLSSAIFKMFWNMPDIVFSKGGYGSFPVVLAARFYRIPVFIHESDAKAGLANKKLAWYAEKVFVGFEAARDDFSKSEVIVSGNPIRTEITEGSADKAKFVFHILRKNKPVILVLGGSQGAVTINELILDNLEALLPNFEVIHIAGTEKYDHITSEVNLRLGKIETTGYHPFPFLTDEMSLAYALADIVVSRAGGGSIFEIAANRKPCILIPLESSAQDHQRINAYEYAKGGAAVILEEFNLTSTILLASLEKLLLPQIRERMIQAAGDFIKVNAASVIAQELINRVYKS